MRSIRSIIALAVCLAIGSGCGRTGFSGGAPSPQPKTKLPAVASAREDDAATIETASGETAAVGARASGSGSSDAIADAPLDVPAPEWAARVDAACTWDGMEADKVVTVRCELQRTDGQAFPELEGLPITWELHDGHGQPRAGATLAEPPAAGLALRGELFHKIVRYITAPVATIAEDVLHIKMGSGPLSKVFDLPIFKRLPILKDGLDLGLCLATSSFPYFCFAKFGLQVADRIIGGAGRNGDARGLLEVHSLRNDVFGHVYLVAGQAPGPGWHDEGIAFYTLAQPMQGTMPLFVCHESGRHFVSKDKGCEGKAMVGPLGFMIPGAHAGAVEYARCYRPDIGDHIVVANVATCGEAGYTIDGSLGFFPLPGFVF